MLNPENVLYVFEVLNVGDKFNDDEEFATFMKINDKEGVNLADGTIKQFHADKKVKLQCLRSLYSYFDEDYKLITVSAKEKINGTIR